ncbi:hypothetical protein [Amorphus orientalis]|uniref:Phosphatidic acid phosphatase type 2/haloperoxidase domain-containing protein n=1 Tax=Amorphus orientalis TaxID=649198 RepID=A0AAE4AUE1_9HYPH|nr:hypothetical protein [Amorphus orientalis]MDQ0317295.1 hypothetical protein [Amorphus orientalis]
MGFPDPKRREDAVWRRNEATRLSTEVEHPEQERVSEKSPFIFSFTKGLFHLDSGLLADPQHFEDFRTGTQSSDPAVFADVPLNCAAWTIKDQNGLIEFRQWESPTAGFAYVLEGPDPLALTMPAAPAPGSAELAAEMAEVYQMALFRDEPIAAFMDESLIGGLQGLSAPQKKDLKASHGKAANAADRLSAMRWFAGTDHQLDTCAGDIRPRRRFGHAQTPGNMFRGLGEDGWPTPFLSQFMIAGTGERDTGMVRFGNQRIDQRVRVAKPGRDYMTTWYDWLDVQNALNARKRYEPDPNDEDKETEFVPGAYRYMSRLRDMATYVHDDALYQAYLNAALMLLGEKYPFDPGIPYHDASDNAVSRKNQEPFALFGGPHLLTLVTEVSSRALKAVRLQKFSVHRRMRPEAAGALFHTIYTGYDPNREHESKPWPYEGDTSEARARRELGRTLATYTFPDGNGLDPKLDEILQEVANKHCTRLLPMAFPEGSPMHPAYGAGHATVAGACVTLLKAFFNMENPKARGTPAYLVPPEGEALVPSPGNNADDVKIDLLSLKMEKGLTLEGELNKLMWNISNARNIAGVHYFTDYIESALLGEAITIGILREQMLAYDPREHVSMTVPLLVPRKLPKVLLNGSSINPHRDVAAVRIDRHGHLHEALPTPGRA